MVFAKITSPPQPQTKHSQTVAWLLAFWLLVMVVGQLFSFEKFVPLIQSYWLPGGNQMGMLVAGLIVTCEVFALPFLLGMKLSPLMRVFSMVCGWAAILLWLWLSLWANSKPTSLANIGLFGTHVPLMVGWWVVFFVVALGILAVWAAWGLWPLRTSHQSLSKH